MAVDVTLKRKGASAFDILHPKTNSNQIEGLAALLDAITIDSLNDIADVIITNPAAGQGFFRNAENDAWVNRAINIDDITGLQAALDAKSDTHTHPYLSNTHDASAVTAALISNWDAAYGWGDHAGLYSLISHNHDSTYLGISAKAADSNLLDGIDSSYFKNNTHTGYTKTNLAVGWYTIATNSGDRAIARFGLRDTASGDHQSVVFYASHHFGSNSDITVWHNSKYSGNPLQKIRIKEGGTYDGALLQVYIDDATNAVTAYLLGDNFQTNGWVLKDWVIDGTNPGGVNNFAALTNVAAEVDLGNALGGIQTTGEVWANGKVLVATDDARLSDSRTPNAHTHGHGDITDFDAEVLALSPAGSRPASDVSDWAKASEKPSYAFSEITGTIDEAQLPVSVFGGLRYVNTQLSNKTTSELMTAINTYLSSKGGTAEGCFFMAGNDITITVSTGHQVNVYMGDEDNTATATETFILHTGDWIIFTRNQGPGLDDIWSVVNNTYPNALTDAYGLVRLSSQTTWANLSGDNVITDAKLKALVESYASPIHTHPYLPTSGGTMSGAINLAAYDLIFKGDGSSSGELVWQTAAGVEDHRIYNSYDDTLGYRANGGTTYKLLHTGILSEISITESQITDLQSYLTTHQDISHLAPKDDPTFTTKITTPRIDLGQAGVINFDTDSGQVVKILGHDGGINIYTDNEFKLWESDSNVNRIGGTLNDGIWYASSFKEDGSLLSAKYLGISAKAADSNLLDGYNSTSFAFVSHKYHSFNNGEYYFDSYAQGNFLRMFIENSTFDTTRFGAIANVEYHNGSAWTAWSGGDASIRSILDGREDTQISIDHTHRRFRFEVTRNGPWPTTALLVLQENWTGLSHPECTVTVETWNGSSWDVKDTTLFGASTTGNTLGIHMKVTTSLHDGKNPTRITIEYDDWTDNGSYVSIPIKRFMILSNFNGISQLPWTWDYYKKVTFAGNVVAQQLYEGNNRVYSPNNKPTASDVGALADNDSRISTWNAAANDVQDYKSDWDAAFTHSTSAHAPSNAQKNSDITKAEIEAKLTGAITSHTHAYEPAFSKNSAFNKNFGTAAGTVAQGNDSRLSDARTPTSHTHGYVLNDGTITTTGMVASSDAIAMVRGNDSKLIKSNISFGSNDGTYLRKDGTWANPDTDTNNYLTGVSGSGNGTVTFTRSGLGNLTWDASHTHAYIPTSHPANNITSTHLYMADGDGFIWDDTNNVMKVRKDGVDYELLDIGNFTAGTDYAPAHTHPYLSSSHPANAVTSTKIGNWDTAYGWGNHAGLYLGISAKAADSTLANGLVVTPAATRNNIANQVVTTNASGYVDFGWINTTSGNTTSAVSDVYVNTSDGYIRKKTLALFKTELGSMPASDVEAWAKAAEKPSYNFSEIGNTPTTLSGYGITDAAEQSHAHGYIGSSGNVTVFGTPESSDYLLISNANSSPVHKIMGGPQISSTHNDQFLRKDGTWQNPPAPSHTHGNITNDGKIGITSGLPVVTGSNGVLSTTSLNTAFNKDFGSSAGQVAEGNHSHGYISNTGTVTATTTPATYDTILISDNTYSHQVRRGPIISSTHNDQFLRKDGTWQTPPSSAPISTTTVLTDTSSSSTTPVDFTSFNYTIPNGKLVRLVYKFPYYSSNTSNGIRCGVRTNGSGCGMYGMVDVNQNTTFSYSSVYHSTIYGASGSMPTTYTTSNTVYGGAGPIGDKQGVLTIDVTIYNGSGYNRVIYVGIGSESSSYSITYQGGMTRTVYTYN